MQWAELNVLVSEAAVEQVTTIMDKFGHGGAVTEKWDSESEEMSCFIVKIFLPNNRNLKKIECQVIEQLSSLLLTLRLLNVLLNLRIGTNRLNTISEFRKSETTLL